MTRSIHQFFTRTETGAIVPNAEIKVNFAGGAEAPIFTTSTGGTAITQPLIATASAKAVFYVEAGVYDIESKDPISLTTATFSNVEISTARADLTSALGSDFNIDTTESLINSSFDTVPAIGTIFTTNGKSTKGDGGGAQWRATGSTITANTDPDNNASNTLSDSDGNEFAMIEDSDPSYFGLLWMGQSNAIGADTGGSTDVEDGVKIWNGLAWVTPVFGVEPLNTDGSNNAGIHFANEIARVTGKPVRMILNVLSGDSIAGWVGSGTSSARWVDLLTQLSESGMTYIDAVGWMQGEADSTTVATGYNTKELYSGGLVTLMSQLQALNAWQDKTNFITSGLGKWVENNEQARNDVLLSVKNNENPRMSNIETTSSVKGSGAGDDAHFSGASLVEIGVKMAGEHLSMPRTASINKQPSGYDGVNIGAIGTYAAAGTVVLDPSQLQGGGVIQCRATTFDLPLASHYDGAEIIFEVTSLTGGSCFLNAGAQSIRWAGQDVNVLELKAVGTYVFRSIGSLLRFVTSQPPIWDYAPQGGDLNESTFTLDHFGIKGDKYGCRDSTIHLPEPNNTNAGAKVGFYAWSVTAGAGPNGGPVVIDIVGAVASKFVNNSSTVVSSITLSGFNNFIELESIRNKWIVTAQNF